MNSSAPSTPEPTSIDGHGDMKTPEQSKTFASWLSHKVRTHVRWWHLFQILVAFVFVAIQYGLAYSVMQLAIGAIGVAGIVFVCWMADDPKRARSAIEFLFLVLVLSLPVSRRIARELEDYLHVEPPPPIDHSLE